MNKLLHTIKGWWYRNMWEDYGPRAGRKLCEFPPICDICSTRVTFHDYGYMCREHGNIYYMFPRMGIIPKFIFRWLINKEAKE